MKDDIISDGKGGWLCRWCKKKFTEKTKAFGHLGVCRRRATPNPTPTPTGLDGALTMIDDVTALIDKADSFKNIGKAIAEGVELIQPKISENPMRWWIIIGLAFFGGMVVGSWLQRK